jgi:hypothetical protein
MLFTTVHSIVHGSHAGLLQSQTMESRVTGTSIKRCMYRGMYGALLMSSVSALTEKHLYQQGRCHFSRTVSTLALVTVQSMDFENNNKQVCFALALYIRKHLIQKLDHVVRYSSAW